MKKLLSVVMAFVLVATMVLADEPINPVTTSVGLGFDLDIIPGNSCPVIDQESVVYFVHTWMDETSSDPQAVYPGSLGYEDLLDLAFAAGWAGRSYAFDGELITFQFEATDIDGIMDDCVQGYVTLDGGYDPRVVQCAKTLKQTENGVDPSTAVFTCAYYVEDAATRMGEHWVSVEVSDSCGSPNGCSDTAPGEISLYLNPAVGMTMKVQGQNGFEFAYDQAGDVLSRIENGQLVVGPRAGDTVYTPYFVIENSADPDTGLYMMLQLYGTDFRSTADVVAMCPTSNRLEIENMEYMARHLNVETFDVSDNDMWLVMPDGTNYGAQEAQYVFQAAPAANFLGVGDDLTMRLRLNIPAPCIGQFTQGGEVVFVGQVI